MGEMKVNVKEDGEILYLTLEGAMDEFAVFANLDLGPFKKIEVDFGGVTSVNSIGIREWTSLLTTFSGGSRMTLLRCPRCIIDQINVLAGFVPPASVVESFYVPYFCEQCQSEQPILFRRGKQFHLGHGVTPGKIMFLHDVPCSLCDGVLQLDVIESKYFRFVLDPSLLGIS